jgi:uncharacterized protein
LTANLFDVNFLIALMWKNHIQHSWAREWFKLHREEPFATCPVTESSFIRLSMNPAVVGEVISFATACSVLEQLQGHPLHRFWTMEKDFLSLTRDLDVSGYRQVTDASLLGLAREKGGRLVSFDRKMKVLIDQAPELEPFLVIVAF